jgi:putative protein-disulfide isomerase
MKPTIYYCYDAYCGWCYGFSSVMKKIAHEYRDQVAFDVLSGGMIFDEDPRHISVISKYISENYKNVEELSGVKFGQDFLWHVFNPDQSDWYPESTLSATALCIFKEYHPDRAVEIAADIQYALNFEGRDLTDKEAYRHLVHKYEIPEEEFYLKLSGEEYKEKAYYEFALVKQLQVNGFPSVLLQVSDSKFYLLARGFTDYDTLKERLDKVLAA